MSDLTNLNNLRNAFSIPESITIATGNFVSGLLNPAIPRKGDIFVIDNNIIPDVPIYTGALGNPVMANVYFIGGTYDTNVDGVTKTYPNVAYDAVLLTVNQPKKLVKTEIQGRDGSVVEYIGLGNYEITINGVITGKNGVRPVFEIDDLKKILDAPVAIEVVSDYLQSLGINNIVIESYTLEQQEGGYSYQTFSINAISDIPQELRLTNV